MEKNFFKHLWLRILSLPRPFLKYQISRPWCSGGSIHAEQCDRYKFDMSLPLGGYLKKFYIGPFNTIDNHCKKNLGQSNQAKDQRSFELTFHCHVLLSAADQPANRIDQLFLLLAFNFIFIFHAQLLKHWKEISTKTKSEYRNTEIRCPYFCPFSSLLRTVQSNKPVQQASPTRETMSFVVRELPPKIERLSSMKILYYPPKHLHLTPFSDLESRCETRRDLKSIATFTVWLVRWIYVRLFKLYILCGQLLEK